MEALLKKAQFALNHHKPQECIAYMQALLEKEASSNLIDINHIKALDLIAQARWMIGLKDLAIQNWEEAIKKLHSLQNNIALEVGLLCNLSHAFLENNETDKAIEAAQKAVNSARKLENKNSDILAFALFTLSAPFYRKQDFKKAEENILAAKNLWEKSGNKEKVSTCMNNLGRIHEELGEGEEGIYWHKKAVELRRLLPKKEDLAFSLANLGVALFSCGYLLESKKDLSEAIMLYTALGLKDSQEYQMCLANLELVEKTIEEDLR